MNAKILREFYISVEEGDDTWHWDLNQSDCVVKDFLEHKNDPSFTIEILDWYDEYYDHIEIYPNNEGISNFPKYIQKSIHKVLDEIKRLS